MKLTTVVLSTSPDNEEVEFALKPQGSRHRYIVRGITGLDADELIPKFYKFGAASVKKFYEFTMKPREISIRVALNPTFSDNEDVSDLRDAVYRLISSTRTGELTLEFRSGASTHSAIKGMMTKLEVAYFAKTPELQITVMCEDPMLRSLNPIDILPADLPSTNPVVLADANSTAPHGFSFKVEFTAVTSTFKIQDKASSPDWTFEVNPTGDFAIGDELHFSSEYGRKLVYHQKPVDPGPIMDKVIAGSVWPQIFPGGSSFHFVHIANFDWLEMSHYPTYWGL